MQPFPSFLQEDVMFPGVEPMTSWSQGNNFTAAPGLPFTILIHVKKKTEARVKQRTKERDLHLQGH
jgi:hypothetical protein